MSHHFAKILNSLLLSVLFSSSIASADRLRVPSYVQCDRNHLTSWTGQVEHYSRTSGNTTFTIKTQESTVEKLSINKSTETELQSLYYLNGKAFNNSNWADIELNTQQIKEKVKVTVWVCLENSETYMVDWYLR